MVVKTDKRQAQQFSPGDTAALQELGRFLGDALAASGVTDRRLAQVAGVSRSNIRFAKQGANLTVLTLVKLARALGIRSIAVGGLTLTGGEIPQAVAAAKEFEEAAMHLQAAARILRELTGVAVPTNSSQDETDRNAAALVRDVMANAKKLGADRLGVLDETLRGLVASIETQQDASPAKTKRSGTGWGRTK
jgi:transcriptional regulator with XRE-family HTH domain